MSTQTMPAAADPLDRARVALRDLAATTGASDGALASCTDRLHVTESLRSLMVSPAAGVDVGVLGLTLGLSEPVWLSGGAAAALGLDAETEVLAVAFATEHGHAAGLLSYDERPHLSAADLEFFGRCFGGAAAPATVIPARDELTLARAAAARRAVRRARLV